MDQHEIRNATWFAAFRELFLGLTRKGLPALNAFILILALAWLPIYYFDRKAVHGLLSGDLPPKVPIIKLTGYLNTKDNAVGIRHVMGYELDADDGRVFEIPKKTLFRGVGDYLGLKLHHIYVEGFLLQNGSGPFWFTSVKTFEGRVFVTPELSMKDLNERGSYYEPISATVLIASWSITLVNLYIQKRKLSKASGNARAF